MFKHTCYIYVLNHLNATEKFTGKSNSPYNEFMVYPSFYTVCNSDFGNKYDGRIYCSDTFGIYKSLEKVNNNGRIMIRGVYTRGRDFYQLENFNYQSSIDSSFKKMDKS